MASADYESLTIAWNRAADDNGQDFNRFYKVIVDGVWRSGSYEESAVVPQLQVGRTYTVQVQSLNTETNNVSAPVTISASTLNDTSPPSTPRNLRETPDGLAWEGSTDNRGAVFYQLFDNGQLFFGTGGGPNITYADLRDTACVVVSGQVITVSVKAIDRTGLLSGATNSVTVRVP